MSSYKAHKIYMLIISFFLFMAYGCHIEMPKSGKVIDAETKEPLKDVIVIVRINISCIPEHYETIAIKETLTDEEGRYKFPLEYYSLPLLCFHFDSYIYVMKPGYFTYYENKKNINMYKMKYFLDFHDYYESGSDLTENYKEAIEKNKTMRITPIGEKGVFLKLSDRKLTKIYSTRNDKGCMHYNPDSFILYYYYVYDENSQEWLAIDGLGRIIETGMSNFPKWDFFDSDNWGWAIFANKELIFYPTLKFKIIGKTILQNIFGKHNINYIKPFKGNISALSGERDDFVTIEGKGSSFCRYSLRGEDVKCYTATNLPKSEEDDSIKDSEFKYIAQKGDQRYYVVVTKTPQYWHIYDFYEGYAREKNAFVEICTFSSDKEITAIAHAGRRLYIAFKDDGIRQYEIVSTVNNNQWEYSFKEVPSFLQNSKKARYTDIKSLTVSYAVKKYVVYAVTGDDKIYRFSTEGIPDYLVAWE